MKVLVAGWFSFPEMGATAGDLLTRDLVCRWLKEAGRAFDVALAPPFEHGVDWAAVNPEDYSDVVFVCGPFGNGWPIPEFLARFAGRRLIGVNLTMLQPLDEWNPFDVLIERESSVAARPDLAFLSTGRRVPVVGLVLVHSQKEYELGAHDLADAAIKQLIEARPMAVVNIDTRLDVNGSGLRTAAEVESMIARMDVVVTTRLHGLVLALKNGVPVVAIDPISGGAKLQRQADAIGWPVLPGDTVRNPELLEAFDYCLTSDARDHARRCATIAAQRLTETRDLFFEAMAEPRRVG